LVTILVAPLMSCSARLPVYLLIIATLVPNELASPALKSGILLALYLIGTAGACGFAWIFSQTPLGRDRRASTQELPLYRWPSLRSVATDTWERVKAFLVRAGTIILALSIALWFFTSFPKSDGLTGERDIARSFAGQAGQVIEPAIRPLGYDWQIGIGLLASVAAREVFVSTMAIIYQVGADEGDEEAANLRLVSALRSQRRADGTPVFDLPTGISLLVFYIFAMQCVSTLAAARRETNSWRWPAFMLLYLTAAAYAAAWVAYQSARWLFA
jgi:ferrous iron transport protein B